MTTTAVDTQGTLLKRGDAASPEVFTSVGQITGITGPDGSASEVDISTLDSTAKEISMGLMDEGTVTFPIIFNPANTQHTGVRDDRTNKTLRNFNITLSNSPATVVSFAAYVTNFSIDSQIDDVVRASITLRISGAVTWA